MLLLLYESTLRTYRICSYVTRRNILYPESQISIDFSQVSHIHSTYQLLFGLNELICFLLHYTKQKVNVKSNVIGAISFSHINQSKEKPILQLNDVWERVYTYTGIYIMKPAHGRPLYLTNFQEINAARCGYYCQHIYKVYICNPRSCDFFVILVESISQDMIFFFRIKYIFTN